MLENGLFFDQEEKGLFNNTPFIPKNKTLWLDYIFEIKEAN